MLREYFVFIHIFILFFNFVGANVKHTTALPELLQNDELFQRFKDSYQRVYPDKKSEQKGYDNFVKNLATVNRLNKEHPGKVIAYQLNRYADLDPEVINDQFALEIKPYDNTEHGNNKAIQREQHHQFLEDMHLYDLNKVDDLYKTWIEKWGKPKFSKKRNNMAQYYRFVKTVVETNRKKFAGEDVSLGEDADVVREPNQYFYG